MLLCEITINAVVFYVSIDGIQSDGSLLTHNWKPRIIGIDAPQLNIPCTHGGYAQMAFGSISFTPELFSGDWPPPVSCPIGLYYTDTTEAVRETIFEGTAHLSTYNRESITYSLYGPSYDETIADATAYNNTLNVILTTILTSIAEITTVNTTYARVTSPNVIHTTAGVQLAIDLASNIAAFYSHLIYVIGDTAYLVDMKRDNGSRTLTEFKFYATPKYIYNPPIALLKCTYDVSEYQAASSYAYGSTESVSPYHTTEANIEAALADIVAIANAPRASFDMPMIAGNFPKLGEKITFPDTSNVEDLSTYIRARKLSYDFINDCITIEGDGVIAA
jgi:hypothetical protein